MSWGNPGDNGYGANSPRKWAQWWPTQLMTPCFLLALVAIVLFYTLSSSPPLIGTWLTESTSESQTAHKVHHVANYVPLRDLTLSDPVNGDYTRLRLVGKRTEVTSSPSMLNGACGDATKLAGFLVSLGAAAVAALLVANPEVDLIAVGGYLISRVALTRVENMLAFLLSTTAIADYLCGSQLWHLDVNGKRLWNLNISGKPSWPLRVSIQVDG